MHMVNMSFVDMDVITCGGNDQQILMDRLLIEGQEYVFTKIISKIFLTEFWLQKQEKKQIDT